MKYYMAQQQLAECEVGGPGGDCPAGGATADATAIPTLDCTSARSFEISAFMRSISACLLLSDKAALACNSS
eukprot:CAMPEP_0204466894 /NCGR_PEP_ID=MMETSP0471-20130131/9430_1 /ASSEMBLY_ACC=CAM_ASM_000602 /TAXON_ID=2969 /ORGANISM="Oxyrrhis marina" /LENGTH=71 /DNA_ID=CAMNT_0051468553 /DNA_START=36 /DNA_END=251 /DNA_ORIENTATION=-